MLNLRKILNIVLAIVGVGAVVGVVVVVLHSAGDYQLYLDPASANVGVNDTVAVAIHIKSGKSLVNAVQANLSYDPSQLEFQRVDESGTAYSLMASTITNPGKVMLARGTGGGESPVSGDTLFATVIFKAISSSGTATISIAPESHVVRSTDVTDILRASAGSKLALKPTHQTQPAASPEVSNERSYPGGKYPVATAKSGLWQTPLSVLLSIISLTSFGLSISGGIYMYQHRPRKFSEN